MLVYEIKHVALERTKFSEGYKTQIVIYENQFI
jgi:hypothetical protein